MSGSNTAGYKSIAVVVNHFLLVMPREFIADRTNGG
jgi:hypothetical protein